MKTIKTIPTLMLAASLGAGMILVSEAALARNNDHQEHSDHQDRNGMGSYNGNGSATCSGRDSGATNKNEKSKPGPECQSDASYLVRLRARSEHNPIWLNFLLNSATFWSYARSQALVSLHQANLNPKRYGQMSIPVPTARSEQDEIVEYIHSHTSGIEAAANRLENE